MLLLDVRVDRPHKLDEATVIGRLYSSAAGAAQLTVVCRENDKKRRLQRTGQNGFFIIIFFFHENIFSFGSLFPGT